MKFCFIPAFIALINIVICFNAIMAQEPSPGPCNIASCIQIPLPGSGTMMVVPNLLTKQSHVSWAHLLPGHSNLENLSWNDVSFALADSTYPAIVGLANKPGSNGFYIVYQNGVVATSTASASGLTAPVVLGRDTNYTQFTYTKLVGRNALYLLTADGNVDVSRDGGQSWQVDSGNAPFNYFIDVAVDTFNNVYAFYSPGGTVMVYKQEANSNTWQPVSFPANQLPTALFIDRRNRFFVSTYTRGVWYSTDTANTWTHSLTTLNGAPGGNFGDDAFGNVYLIAHGGAQLFSSDTGANWTEIDAPITSAEVDSNYLDVINSISGDSVLTASTIYGIYVSQNQGANWAATNAGLHETQFNGFFRSPAGRFVETSNNGLFYADANSFTHPLPVNGFGWAGPLLADTLGNIYTSTETGYLSGKIFHWKSSDYGGSWMADTDGVLQVSSPGTFGVDEYGTEYLSGKGSFGVQLFYKKILGSNSYVLDTAGLYGMTDFFYIINAIASDENGRLFIGGGGDANRLTCWSRPINGSEWIADTAGLTGYTGLSYLTRESNHNMLAIADGGIFYHQAGIWNSMPFPVVDTGSLQVNAVAADNSGGIIASFTYTLPSFLSTIGYGIYCTHDHGTTWTEVGLHGVNVYGLYNFGDTTYALSDLGIFALTCSGIVGPLDIAQTGLNVNNLTLYPNPSSGICHAAFALASTSEKSELAVMDISGRLVKTILIVSGIHEVSFDTGDMNSGIYFCVLKSGESIVDVKKLVVAK